MDTSWLQNIVRGLGTQNAPFGFAPVGSPSQGAVDPAYNAGMQMIGNVGMGMLASGEKNPMKALGRSYLVAQQQAQQKNKDDYIAAKMFDEADYKKQERAQAAEKQKWIEDQISQLPPEQQGIARMMPEKFFGAKIEEMFPKPNSGNSSNWGMSVVPLKNKRTGELRAGQFNQGQGGIFVDGQPADPNEWVYDPGALSQDRAEGTMIGSAPKVVIEDYTKNIRPQMSNLADTVTMLGQANTYLKKGIQTGSNSDKIQALRSLGAQLGFNVDEQVLANTQSYQNFIGNVVIPRMKELGGNDSNEELAKLYSLSGGDINQSLPALVNTLDFMEKLQTRKFKRLKASEDVALKYIPGLTPIDLGSLDGSAAPSSSNLPDVSTMSDAELEALANGK